MTEHDLPTPETPSANDSEPKDLTPALRKQIDLLGSANRALDKQADNLHRRVEHLREELKTMAKDKEALRALVRKLTESLEFYGDKRNYRSDKEEETPILRDAGFHARSVLSHLGDEDDD
jgi:chromosome segregation ATPase